MSPGVRMSCWPLLKETFHPLRTPPGWPFLACTTCLSSCGGGCRLPRCTQSCLGHWVPPGTAKLQPQAGSTRTRFRTSWSHSSGHFFPTLFFPFVAFFFFFSWKHATPRGCPRLLLLTPKLLVSSLSLLRESWSRQGHRKRRHSLFPVVLSHPIGSRNWGKRETELGWYMGKSHYSKLETSCQNILSSILLRLHAEGIKDGSLSYKWGVENGKIGVLPALCLKKVKKTPGLSGSKLDMTLIFWSSKLPSIKQIFKDDIGNCWQCSTY